ncbi:MAG: (d)CMP kinase [Chloroflexota bacterium]
MENYPTTITIDGPAASGKTTIGYQLAEKLGYIFLDTGVMYRAVTLAALNQGIDPHNEPAVISVAEILDFKIQPEKGHEDGRHYTVWVNGEDATWEIRNPDVNKNVSAVSAYPEVRDHMVRLQREFAEGNSVVMVGRDIGTVVLPDAPVKIYLDASAEIRARRRMGDHLNRNYNTVEFEKILADIVRRDEIDSSREHSPLKPAADAIVIDTTKLKQEDVLHSMWQAINGRSLSQ